MRERFTLPHFIYIGRFIGLLICEDVFIGSLLEGAVKETEDVQYS